MKLKPIPQNTVVHTPTEAEAKELLAILHENGYRSHLHGIWNMFKDETVIFVERSWINFGNLLFYKNHKEYTILTLAEFQRLYCEEEKPQPKFKVGDKVKVIDYDHSMPLLYYYKNKICRIIGITRQGLYKLELVNKALDRADEFIKGVQWCEFYIEPYTEPETKPTEAMEENKEINKELNLCELLRGHEGEMFFAPICGTEIELKKLFSSFLSFYLDKENVCTVECDTKGNQVIGTVDKGGQFQTVTYQHGSCMVYPSKALYEQYPLDPYTAWMEWKEEQKKYALSVAYIGSGIDVESSIMFFRTSAERDKCIQEIKAIIEKYSKK